MYEYLLPIGSIVKLNGFGKLLMIFGVLQKSAADTNVIYDYIGVPYPEGHYDSKLHVGFNKGDIEEVIFRGYEDNNDERKSFLVSLDIAAMFQEKLKKEKRQGE